MTKMRCLTRLRIGSRMPSELFWYMVGMKVLAILEKFMSREKLDYAEQLIQKDQIVEIKRLESVTD